MLTEEQYKAIKLRNEKASAENYYGAGYVGKGGYYCGMCHKKLD